MRRWNAMLAVLLLTGSTRAGEITTHDVDYEVNGVAMRGYFAAPARMNLPLPGVLVVHEWWGVNDYAKMRARMLAELGYAAFVIDMFGKGRVTDDPEQAGKWAGEVRADPALATARFMAGFHQLTANAAVDPARIAAIGYCFGGTSVLNAARAGAPLVGVVSFHGDLATQHPAAAGVVRAKVLVCHGDADPMVPDEQVRALEKEMTDAKVDFSIIRYPDAKHSFTNPNADKVNIDGVGYNQPADKKSWEDMRGFLGEVFGK